MSIHPLAGRPAPRALLVNVPRLVSAYYTERPDPERPEQRVSFGTSGHRGSALRGSFNEPHILATTQAICEYRKLQGTDGPLYLGIDSHALSEPARITALEVLARAGIAVRIDAEHGYTPTPVVSHAILRHNRGRSRGLADGIVVTPSHNPPEDGGFKYNPPHGGPADTQITDWIERRANEILERGCRDVQRMSYRAALDAPNVELYDFVAPYVEDLAQVLDLDAIRGSGLRLGADPLGGASVRYWAAIAERHRLSLELVNDRVDPTFSFMPVDHDGKIRMDCSSPYAMSGLIELKDTYDVAFGNDTDADRHGIVARSAGLLNPNHYLCVAVSYLFRHRPSWPAAAAIGKTLVTSSLIDRIAVELGRRVVEVPVGFKWFVSGLLEGWLGFGGEESAGAAFLRKDGQAWTTDKDGILLALLAAEISARTGRDPGELYRDLTQRHGEPAYARIDAPATAAQRSILKRLAPEQVPAKTLAGEAIQSIVNRLPESGAAVGGIKVSAASGWFAARPSGTEDVYKIYAESWRGAEHLRRIQQEAQAMVDAALGSSPG